MWSIKRVYATNIISFTELELDVSQHVATLIFGQNKDNASQQCNGSGKSSLIEAIAFGITGSPLRDVKSVDEIINDSADDATVQLVFDNDYDNRKFIVDRFISRTDPQRIECHMMDGNGDEIMKEKTVQPSVNEYNKFILDELGVSRDELYNNYILCRNHYKSFLDASDKDKKEIINRFSNGVIVDDAIDRLLEEMVPVEDDLSKKHSVVIVTQGKIEALQGEINDSENKQEQARLNREQQIQRCEQQITQKRQEIRDLSEKVSRAQGRINSIEHFDLEAQELEESEKSISECYQILCERFTSLGFEQMRDYANDGDIIAKSAESANIRVSEFKKSLDDLSSKRNNLIDHLHDVKKSYESEKEKYDKENSDDEKLKNSLTDEIGLIKEDIDTIDKEIKEANEALSHASREIANINQVLYGTITCPKCSHQFLVNSEKSLEQLNSEKALLEKSVDKYTSSVSSLTKERAECFDDIKKNENKIHEIRLRQTDRNASVAKLHNDFERLQTDAQSLSSQIISISQDISNAKIEIDSVNGKISNLRKQMFDHVFNVIDNKKDAGKGFIKNTNEAISFNNGQIEQYQSTIKQLRDEKINDIAKSLEASKKKYEDDLAEAQREYDTVKAKVGALKMQRDYFADFKSHLANQKIDAIASVTNSFLEQIGSDIRLQLEGFRKLKSGKVRDKITVKILRNGIDYGSFAKLSAGEKTRVYLANILAMQKITNANCDDGKGLDIIIIDELLDASDESGIASYCDAFNELGVTAFVITQGMVAEGYPHKLVVSKENGVSTIKN